MLDLWLGIAAAAASIAAIVLVNILSPNEQKATKYNHKSYVGYVILAKVSEKFLNSQLCEL